MKNITIKDILYGRGNSSQYSVTAYTGKESRVDVCITDSLGCTPKSNIKLKTKYTPIKLQRKMGINPSFKEKKKKEFWESLLQGSLKLYPASASEKTEKKAERLELRTWLLRSLFSKGQHILLTANPQTHRQRRCLQYIPQAAA